MIDVQRIVKARGGTGHGSSGTFPGLGHSATDRSVTISARSDGRGVVIHSFAGGDWRAEQDDLVRRGLLEHAPVRVGAGRAKPDTARQRREREAERHRAHVAAAVLAEALWQAAKPATEAHAYLARKAMRAGGFREHNGLLLIPMRDLAGRPWNLQRITADGRKLFMSGARVDGLGWWRGKPGDTIAIGEGVATMAAVHAATGLCSIAAFTAGNLQAVTRAVRSAHPHATLILCADDDAKAGRIGNPGVEAATTAARAMGGLVAMPPRPPGWPIDQGFDFDNCRRALGDEAARRAILPNAGAETVR